MRQQFADATCRLSRQTSQDILQVGKRLVPIEFGRLDEAHELAREVEAALAGPDYAAFILNRWSSEPTACSDELTGWPRLRVIVNAMTRKRFCTPEGAMELKGKGCRRVAAIGQRKVAIMVMNRIQLQPGLSISEFLKNYGTEAQ